MEDDRSGSRKRGLFQDVSQEPMAKVARYSNAEYRTAFAAFDTDRSGTIELAELGGALQTVQQRLEGGSLRPFNLMTCCWLCARFGDGVRLNEAQFCELLDYVANLRTLFEQVDADRSGSISCDELHRAFQLSGVAIGSDVIVQVGRSFDANQTGTLEFDEFVQMRLEWDCYVAAWDNATKGSPVIQPEQLINVVEEIKNSLEPVGTSLVSQAEAQVLLAQGLFYSSMFKVRRPLHMQTCQWLIIRFGEGNLCLNFGQFATMLVFMKEMKAAFSKVDTNGSGSLDVAELYNAFAGIGMQIPPELVMQIGQSFDHDQSGAIEFDEFVQMAVEWNDMWRQQGLFSAQASSRIDAATLQELFGKVRVLYRVVDGAALALRPFSLHTCRWLVALFGTPRPGEVTAQGMEWTEFLNLTQYVKGAYAKFQQCNFNRDGCATTEELRIALSSFGLELSREVVDNVRRAYDMDNSGSLTFDEFLLMLVECRLYDQCFEARLRQPATLTPLNAVSPLLGQVLATGASQGLITLDRSAFFSMVFAVPRNLN
mmetsp:Transcript_103247/g.266914  ORF Transcript_103247/g.266914 Transcript_103247/m.266914 type:complete len:541 (-) Transcript_103247:398-2020(-)